MCVGWGIGWVGRRMVGSGVGSVTLGRTGRGRRGNVILQLDPPIPLESEVGPGLAHFLVDYGPESSVLWGLFTEAGIYWVPNEKVKPCKNWSMERVPFAETEACLDRMMMRKKGENHG